MAKPEGGFNGVKKPESGLTNPQTPAQEEQPTNPGSTGYGSGSGSGYRRSGSGSGSGTDPKEKQTSIGNVGDIYGKAKNATDKTYGKQGKNLNKNYKDRYNSAVKRGKDQLKAIGQQREANTALRERNSWQNMRQINWQPNQQKEQSTLMALRNRMGNAAYGSAIQDLAEGMQRVDDMNDVELINAWKQNEDAAYNNWFQAEQDLIGNYNDTANQIASTLDELRFDYNTDRNNLQKQYDNANIDLEMQYATGMNNAAPLLATKENLAKAAKNASGKTKTAKAEKKASAALKKAKGVAKQVKGSFNGKAKNNAYEPAASKIIQKAVNDPKNKEQKKKVEKAANLAAKKAVTKAQKAFDKAEKANRVYAGEGDNKLYLPNVDLSKRIEFNSIADQLKPSGKFAKQLELQPNASEVNPRTAEYVRGDRSYALNNSEANIDTSRQANSGFGDNLAAFTRSQGPEPKAPVRATTPVSKPKTTKPRTVKPVTTTMKKAANKAVSNKNANRSAVNAFVKAAEKKKKTTKKK